MQVIVIDSVYNKISRSSEQRQTLDAYATFFHSLSSAQFILQHIFGEWRFECMQFCKRGFEWIFLLLIENQWKTCWAFQFSTSEYLLLWNILQLCRSLGKMEISKFAMFASFIVVFFAAMALQKFHYHNRSVAQRMGNAAADNMLHSVALINYFSIKVN